MLISIDHETVYRYADDPAHYTIQSLRLTPQPFKGQLIRNWKVSSPQTANLHPFVDGFGNSVHTLVVDNPHSELRVRVTGKVDTADTGGVVAGTVEPFPPEFFLRKTELIEPDAAIRTLARMATSGSKDRLEKLHRLMEAVRDAVDYKIDASHAATTAAEAVAAGEGVCQDHAHIFIAAAHSLEIPARYVSGYLLANDEGEPEEASHAWAEAFVPDLGWVGFDCANRTCPNEFYVRLASGLDYASAAPVRGMRRGGGEETLSVSVKVAQAQSNQ